MFYRFYNVHLFSPSLRIPRGLSVVGARSVLNVLLVAVRAPPHTPPLPAEALVEKSMKTNFLLKWKNQGLQTVSEIHTFCTPNSGLLSLLLWEEDLMGRTVMPKITITIMFNDINILIIKHDY